jgi:transposase
MTKVPRLSEAVQKQVLRQARDRRWDPDAVLRLRAVLAVAAGRSRRMVASVLSVVPSTVVRAVTRFRDGGFEALEDGRRNNGEAKITTDFLEQLHAVLDGRADDFGWFRPTWTREALALTMAEQSFPLVAPCTMGRALRAIAARRGRPKPSVSCPWPEHLKKKTLRALRRLEEQASDEEPVVYSDEVDIHLNPKVGADWMNRGTQRDLPTPGKNQKHYLAGALDAQTRDLVWVDAPKKNSALFLLLLDRLQEHYAQARLIHVILDNYKIHSSRAVETYLAKPGCRIRLHFLPPYCPDHNRIERAWQDLHANVTRNHRCATMLALLVRVIVYLIRRHRDHEVSPSIRCALPVAA